MRYLRLLRFLPLLAVGCAASSLLDVSDAHAQQADSAYLELISEALAEYDEGHWPEARALFERAHVVEPNARTQRGIGMCAFAMRDYVGAVVALESSLVDTRRPLEPSQRTQVEELLRRARGFVARMRIESDPDDVTIEVDGHPPVIRDGIVMLNPGRHEIHVASREHDATTRVVDVATSSEFELRVELVRRSPASTPVERSARSPMPWLVVGGGGATLVSGALILGLGRRNFRDVNDAAAGTPWPEVDASYDRAPKLTGVGIALFGVGLAGVGAGLTWALIRGDGNESEETDTSVTVGLGSLVLERRF